MIQIKNYKNISLNQKKVSIIYIKILSHFYIKENEGNNDKNNNKEKKLLKNEDEYDIEIIKKRNKRKRIYHKNQNLEETPLSTEEIKILITDKNITKEPIIRICDKNHIKTKYLYLSNTDNYIYYACYQKKLCYMGKAKIDIKNKKFIITEYCDNKIAHLNIDYNEFVKLMKLKIIKKLISKII